jgi:hypothetical protein
VRLAALLLLVCPLAATVTAQTYEGSYSAVGKDGNPVTLTLQLDALGQVSGTMQGSMGDLVVTGSIEQDLVVGRLSDRATFVFFRAELQPSGTVRFEILEPDADGRPNYARVVELVFTRTAAQGSGAAPPPARARASPSDPDPYVGSFSDGRLTLHLQGSGGSYSGIAQYLGQNYPVTVSDSGGVLTGSFTAPGGQYPLRVVVRTDGLVVTTDDATFELRRIQRAGGKVGSAAEEGAAQSAPTPLPPDMMGDRTAGYFFTAPAGWQGEQTETGFVFRSTTKPGLMIVLPHELTSLGELEAEARMGIEEDGVMLFLDGEVTRWEANGVAAKFKGTVQGRQARAQAIGLLSPHGGGVTVLAMVDSNAFDATYVIDVEAVAKSVVFRPPK